MRSTRRILLAVAAFIFAFSAVPAFGASYLGTVDFSDANHGYLGGWYGNNPRSGFMSTTNDGGATWHAILTGQSSPVGLATSGMSVARAVSDTDDLVLSTSDAGAIWVRNTPVAGGGASFSDIAKSARGYVAVGKRIGTDDGDVGIIYKSADGINGWTPQFVGPIYLWEFDADGGHPGPRPQTHARMDKVAFAPGGMVGWAIGSEWSDATYGTAAWNAKGVLLSKTVDGGSTWTTPTALTGRVASPMNDIVVTDETHAYAVGAGRRLIQTKDGTNWVATLLPPIATTQQLDAYGIDAFDATHLVAVGYTTAHVGGVQWTTNGGTTWSTASVSALGVKLRSVSMLTATNWVVVGDSETLGRTSDAGATWTWTTATPPKVTLTSPMTYGAAFPSTRIVAGTASDVGAGVAYVDVSVLRDDGTYWNPDIGWVPAPFWNRASPENGWDTWSWNWQPEAVPGVHSYTVTARSTDAVGQSASSVVTRPVARIAGDDRYGTAAALARAGWDPTGTNAWTGVHDIVIANGEPGKESDPLTAAGLAGVYDAPVLTVQATRVPIATKTIITQIALKNPGVRIHIVGGAVVVPDARWNDIRRIPGVSQVSDRIAGRDRYETSALMANRIVAQGAGAVSGVILIAGDNPAAFYDALAASPIAYARTMPMLSVKKGSIPPSVNAVLNSAALKNQPRYAASSATYIGTVAAANAKRLTTSSNRYTAATQIAGYATDPARTWTSLGDTALASQLPDALTGGAFLGRVGGVMLFTDSSSAIQSTSKAFLSGHSSAITRGWVVGGTSVLPPSQETSYRNLLNP